MINGPTDFTVGVGMSNEWSTMGGVVELAVALVPETTMMMTTSGGDGLKSG